MTNSSTKSGISNTKSAKRWFQGRAMTVAMLAGCLLVVGVVFWKIGTSGAGSSLFFLLLLACPLLHFLMHRGHGEEGHRDHDARL